MTLNQTAEVSSTAYPITFCDPRLGGVQRGLDEPPRTLAGREVRRYTDPRAQHLTQSEGMVMRYLQGAPDAAPSQIAGATGLQRTNLSTVLKALEKKGLIERHASPGDARGVQVHLTQPGRTNYTIVRREWAEAVLAAANGDTTNLDAALALLTTIKEGLTKMRPTNRGTLR